MKALTVHNELYQQQSAVCSWKGVLSHQLNRNLNFDCYWTFCDFGCVSLTSSFRLSAPGFVPFPPAVLVVALDLALLGFSCWSKKQRAYYLVTVSKIIDKPVVGLSVFCILSCYRSQAWQWLARTLLKSFDQIVTKYAALLVGVISTGHHITGFTGSRTVTDYKRLND